MYTRIYIQTDYRTNKNIYHIWDDKTGYRTGPVKMEAYEPHPLGKYTSMFGEKLNKVTHFIKNDPTLIESDVNLETKTLIDEYLNEDEGSTENRVVFFDIEVDSRNGFPNVDIADNEVTAFSLYYQQENKYYCVILDKENRIKEHQIDNKIIVPVKSEFDLLFYFIKLIQEIDATIISGWNSEGFDIPYLIHRCYKVLGKDITKQLSPIGIISENPKTKKIIIAGRNHIDYMLMFKKLHAKIMASYSLNNVGTELVNTGKIEYKGSLDDLYINDINKFIEYNINDVVIIKKLDDKYKYINLAISLLSKCHVSINTNSITKSSVFLEGVILTYLRRKNLISKNKPLFSEQEKSDDNESFEGAFVKEPILGRHKYLYDNDFSSMYPNLQLTLNISPETKVGIVPDWNVEKYIVNELSEVHYENKKYTIEEFKNFLLEKNYTISPNGVLYDQNKKGIIPEILETWYNERKELRKLEKKYGDENNKELYEYYNRLQRSVKICLNSMYGVLGLKGFRFYDIDNALSTTQGAQLVLKISAKLTDSYKNKLLGIDEKVDLHNLNESGIVYADSDSIFLSAVPIIEKLYPNADYNDEDFMVEKTIEVAKKMETYINDALFTVTKHVFNSNNNRMSLKQEVVAKSSFFLAKKRYIQWIVNKNGIKLKEPELEMKAIDVVRSSYPIIFKKQLKQFCIDILNNLSESEINKSILSFERKLKQVPVIELAKNTSVHFQSDDGKHIYHDDKRKRFEYYKGTPAQVKAVLFYNDLIDEWRLNKKVEKIKDGQKIKWVYLKNGSEYNGEQIALKADDTDPEEIMDYIKENIDRRKLYEKELKTKIMAFYEILHWEYPSLTKELYNSFR